MLENDLRKAIGRGELQLHYQPVVNAQTEELSGFEALVRWHHPTRGVISPSLFVPLAEECGLILQIGEWVLRTACDEAAKWPEHIRVAVNLSPIQFVDPNLPATVDQRARQLADSTPRQLELEITEGVFLVESESTDDMFAKLKSIGVRLALDDFGTGYSSLGYLKKAPFDKIKIDQSFVRGAAKKDSRNAAIIRAIVTLAESLGMDTTAEGAETHDELDPDPRARLLAHPGLYLRPADERGRRPARSPRQNKAVDRRRLPVQPAAAPGPAQGRQPAVERHVRCRCGSATSPPAAPCSNATARCRPSSKVQLDLPGCGNLGAEVRWTEAKPHGHPVRGRVRPAPAGAGQEHGLRRQARRGPLHAPQIFRGCGRQVAAQVRRPALLSQDPDSSRRSA